MDQVLLRITVYWLVLAIAVVANATFSQFVIAPRYGDYRNHVYKSVVATLFIFGAAALFARTTGETVPACGWLVGSLWFGMTVAFEFVFGHYVFGNPWEKLFADYRFWKGRLWSLVLAADLFAPPLMFALLK